MQLVIENELYVM